MDTFRLVTDAVRSTRHLWRLVVLFWLISLVISGLASLPAVTALSARLSHSTTAMDMSSRLPIPLMGDLGGALGASMAPFSQSLAIGMAVMQVFFLFAVPGTLVLLVGVQDGSRPTPLSAWVGMCARFAGRTVRLAGWSLIPMGALLLTASLTERAIERFARYQLSEEPVLRLELGRFLLLLVLWLVVRVILDAARADMVLSRRTSMRHSLWGGMRLVGSQPVVLIPYALTGAGFLLLAAILMACRFGVPDGSWPGILAGMVVGQFAILFRMGGVVATSCVALRSMEAARQSSGDQWWLQAPESLLNPATAPQE